MSLNEREQLAKDIWYTGSNIPEVIADYLIEQGWSKRSRVVVTNGSQISALEQINQASMVHQFKGTVRRRNSN